MQLHEHIPRGSAPPDELRPPSRTLPAPVDLHVLDLIADITRAPTPGGAGARQLWVLARPDASPRPAARAVSRSTPARQRICGGPPLLCPSCAPVPGERIEGDAARWLRRCELTLGLVARSHHLEQACPHCAAPSLVASIERWVIRCANPGCRDPEGRPHDWPVTAPVLRHVVGAA
ncbi:MAG: hypothetical protein ACRC35_08505 [Angustibacter sp.]